jgi:hypothetical protein
MATPAPSQATTNTIGTSGPSAQSRWGRSGEPGSAFSGLGRAGRGRGHGRGRGGARGGRGGATAREAKIGDTSSDKTDPTTTRSAPAPCPASKAELSAQPSGREKNSPVPNSKPKGPSRRPSRAIPAVAVPQLSPSAPSSPVSTRPVHRRKRSQSGKAIVPPTINVPLHDDTLLRPPRNRFSSAPHSAPIKDTPPHLAKPFDMRNNIDALVERVRAVAMADNRPSTPGSHIDWAGDDDDSLPDLDDWGVTPGISAGEKVEMSPIIVDGLKSLPELVMQPTTLTPEQGQQSITGDSAPSTTDASEKEGKVLSAVSLETQSTYGGQGKAPNTLSTSSMSSSVTGDLGKTAGLAKPPLHPSLPPKPIVLPEVSVVLPKSRHGPAAMPMRNPFPRGSSVTPAEKSELKAIPPVSPQPDLGTPPVVQVDSSTVHSPSGAPTNEDLLSKDNPIVSLPAAQKDDPDKDGLFSSIHAPQALLESASAPAGLSSNYTKTHTRAHTVGKPYTSQAELSRLSRSGHSTPRGGMFSGGHHGRTHSSPPAGAILNNHRNPQTQRPVLTGDAISRLARTIGGNALSPPRAAAATAVHD